MVLAMLPSSNIVHLMDAHQPRERLEAELPLATYPPLFPDLGE
jgi:hypothetical protein